MQAPLWVVRLVTWRWMPSVALVAGSLAFAGVAILIVPDDLGGVASGTEQLSRAARARIASNATAPPEEAVPVSGEEERAGVAPALPARHLASPRSASHDVVQSIFHSTPPIELPVAPVDPEPQAPPPPPAPPPPTATIYSTDSPPPMQANPMAGPPPEQ